METTKELEYLQEKLGRKDKSMGILFITPNHHNIGPRIYIDDTYFSNGEFISTYQKHIIDLEKDVVFLSHPVTTDDILLWSEDNDVFCKISTLNEDNEKRLYMLGVNEDGKEIEIEIDWQLGKDLSGQTPETIHELFTFVKEIEEGKNST